MGTSWHLADGLSCLIESFISGLLSDHCQADQCSPLGGGFVQFHSEQHSPFSAAVGVMMEAHYSDLSQNECVNSIQIPKYINVWQRTVHFIFLWLEDSLVEDAKIKNITLICISYLYIDWKSVCITDFISHMYSNHTHEPLYMYHLLKSTLNVLWHHYINLVRVVIFYAKLRLACILYSIPAMVQWHYYRW